jgi:hypothetical protein
MLLQGLHRIGLTDYKQWLNGIPLTYSNWKSGQPTLQYSENHCAGIQYKYYYFLFKICGSYLRVLTNNIEMESGSKPLAQRKIFTFARHQKALICVTVK